MIALLACGAWVSTAKAATISASPNPCPTISGQTSCKSTLSWNAAENSQAQIWVSMDSSPEQLFACGVAGSQSAPWILPGHGYTFTLYQSQDCTSATKGNYLNAVFVDG